MLRYFYIIFLLVCIKWSFCDDYISNKDLDYRNGQNKLVRSSLGRLHRSSSNNRKYRDTPDYVEEEEEAAPLAQIDVASFINGDNQEEISGDVAVDDNSDELQKETDSRYVKSFENNYGTPSGLNWNYNINSNLQDYQNNEESADDITKSKHYEQGKRNLRFNREMNIGDLQNVPLIRSRKDESSDSVESRQHNNDLPHEHQKKCALKRMRIPFFSHDKSTKASKKGKKRKFLNFNYKNENKQDVNNLNKNKQDNHELSSSMDDVTAISKVEKRSLNSEFICPLCKSVFKRNAPDVPRVRRFTNNIVHNSRQFYAIRNPKAVEAETREPEDMDSLKSLEILERRLERQTPSDEEPFNKVKPFEKGQQLRELEEVERRINEIGERTKYLDKPKQNF